MYGTCFIEKCFCKMGLDSRDRSVCDLLMNSGVVLPLAYGAWFFDSDEVFLSNKLKLILSAADNFLKPHEFVQCMKSTFGSFLNTAVEEVALSQSTRREYSSITKSKNGEDYHIRLVFDQKKSFYILLVEKSKEDKKLKYSDSMFDNIMNAIPLYVWQKNIDSQITYCNKKYSDALETAADLVIENNLKLVSAPRSGAYINQNIYSSKPKTFKDHAVIKGKRHMLEVTELPFVGNSPSIGFAIDITDIEDLQKEYKIYKKQTEETLDHISVPIAIFDEKTTLIFANKAILKLFGVDESYLSVDRSISEIFDLLCNKGVLLNIEDIQVVKNRALKLFIEVVEPYHVFFHLQNGKTFNVTVSPNYGGGLIFLFQDISDKIAL